MFKKDGRHDEKDACPNRRDDGHDHGGHHQALPPTYCPSYGVLASPPEIKKNIEDQIPALTVKRGPERQTTTSISQENVMIADMGNAKHWCCLDVVGIFDCLLVHLPNGGVLDDVDYLLRCAWLILLLHFEVILCAENMFFCRLIPFSRISILITHPCTINFDVNTKIIF